MQTRQNSILFFLFNIRLKWSASVFIIAFLMFTRTVSAQQSINLTITKQYLNIPVGDHARMKMIELNEGGKMKREFPVQLAEDSVSYWIYIDVSEFKGKSISIRSHAKEASLKRIYQDDQINGSD